MLPGKLDDFDIDALPDTGAELNIMSLALAKQLGFWIDNTETNLCVLPNNKTVRSLGTVTEHFRFRRETESHAVKFDILPNPPHDLILGDLFLSRTETLTSNYHRLQRKPMIEPALRSCCSINCSRARIMGRLGDNFTLALPDTGCMANLISLSYALKHGLRISTTLEDRGYLRYADGSVEQTLGRVTLPWAFADQLDKSILLDFEVVADCRYDIIMGQHMLLDEKAYAKHSGSFLKAREDLEDEDDAFELNPVGWTPNWIEMCKRKPKTPKATSKFLRRVKFLPMRTNDAFSDAQSAASPTSLDDVALALGSLQTYRDLRDTELTRRANADGLNETIPELEKSQVQEEEIRKRTAWDAKWNVVWLRQNNAGSSSSTNASSLAPCSALPTAAPGRPP